MSKMKVALCFWGICRSTDLVLKSIESCVFNALRKNGIKFDVYLHTYTLYRPYTNPRAKEENIQLKNSLWKLLKPKEFLLENQDVVDQTLKLFNYKIMGNPWTDDNNTFNTLENHVRALWSLKQVTSLWMKKESEYDAVLYLRPDVRYFVPFQAEWLNDLKPYILKCPDFHLTNGCNDRFALGMPSVAKLFGNRFDEALEYAQKYRFHSEEYLAYILQKNKIIVELIPFKFRRIRANGDVCEADQNI
jgi:hypothetical protein